MRKFIYVLAKKVSIFGVLFFIANFKRKHVTRWRYTIWRSFLMYLLCVHTSVVYFFIECSAYVLAYSKLFSESHFAHFKLFKTFFYTNTLSAILHYFLEAHALNSNRRSFEIRFNFVLVFVKSLSNRES